MAYRGGMTDQQNDGDHPADDAVRRSLRAGALVGGLTAIVTGLWFSASGGGPGVVLGLTLGFFVGLAVASGWLMLAMVVDAMAGERLSARRIRWTAGLVAACFIAPPVFLRLLS